MADATEQLAEYKLQLQQVEAALTVDPNNEELSKLRTDLEEVIQLTTDLIASQQLEAAAALPSGSGEGSLAPSTSAEPEHVWSVGDLCIAPWSEDGMLYEAKIDEVLADGTCTVTFTEYGNTDVTKMSLLQPVEGDGMKRGAEDGDDGPDSKKPMTKRDKMNAQREYKRKKNQKKASRIKELESEREREKDKWLEFNAKAFSKSNKGRVKRSIFATPDTVQGRVGVGTCGVGGKPMTNYDHQVKWKKC